MQRNMFDMGRCLRNGELVWRSMDLGFAPSTFCIEVQKGRDTYCWRNNLSNFYRDLYNNYFLGDFRQNWLNMGPDRSGMLPEHSQTLLGHFWKNRFSDNKCQLGDYTIIISPMRQDYHPIRVVIGQTSHAIQWIRVYRSDGSYCDFQL